jgi:hypothetical protein
MTGYSWIHTPLQRTDAALQKTQPEQRDGIERIGNKLLKFFAVGNLSFTCIVNHTRQDLRRGKNHGLRAKGTHPAGGVAYPNFLKHHVNDQSW